MIMRKDMLTKTITTSLRPYLIETVLQDIDYGLEKPLYVPTTTTMNFFESAFGVGSRLYFDGDQVKYGPSGGLQDYLETMKDWYSKDLSTKNFMVTQVECTDGYPDKAVTLSGSE